MPCTVLLSAIFNVSCDMLSPPVLTRPDSKAPGLVQRIKFVS